MKYFYQPTQVAFWDEDHYTGGIAYHDEIICGCCGGIVDIEELYELTPVDVDPIIPYEYWVDFSVDILDETEEVFTYEEDEEEEESK